MAARKILLLLLPFLSNGQISQIIDEWKLDKDLKNASISVCAVNTKNAELIYEYNSHQLLIPASTLKIITTAAAINLLGSNYRYETKIYYTGDFNKTSGVLNGDLVIVGSGDPTLQSENFSKENGLVTDKWAKVLKEKGLKEITGNIIGDGSFFKQDIPGNWTWEDVNNYYAAAPCGLSYMDNKFKVFYTSAEVGTEAKITGTFPSYRNKPFNLISKVISQGKGDEAYAYGEPFSFAKEIRGTIPANKKSYEVEVVLPDPALLCAENLYTSLKQIGITCKENCSLSLYQKKDNDLTRQLLYTHFSPALERIIFFTNQKSNNHYCETLLLTMGKGDRNAGLNAVNNYWCKKGLDSNEVYMEDGSGLSRINTVTTHYEVAVLSKVRNDSLIYKIINPSLPLAGKQGSMSSIGKGKFIENNLRAKTGYIRRARAYCGYVRSKTGKEFAFSIIFNNYNCSASEAKIKMEKFLVALGEL